MPVDFVALGTPPVQRGFYITPVHPETKKGCLKNLYAANTVPKLEKIAQWQDGKYAHYCIGVVSRRGIDKPCFLDIDYPGVIARIERETGHKMPVTYIVQSRPQSNPDKLHYYFWQTAYSFQKFGGWDSKNANVRDLTALDDEGKTPTMYDLKGVGGVSFVVGPGSVRDSGEIYTAIDPDAKVVDIPDWLVDWLVADIEKYRLAKEQIREERCAAKAMDREKCSSAVRATRRKQNLPQGFDIYSDDIYWFLLWRAGQLAKMGCNPAEIEQALVGQAERFCHDGIKFTHTSKGREAIHKIAHDSGPMGNASWYYRKKDGAKHRGLIVTPNPKTSVRLRFEAMVEIIERFPDMNPTKAYNRLRRELKKVGFDVDKDSVKDRMTVSRARKAAGREIRDKMWVRR